MGHNPWHKPVYSPTVGDLPLWAADPEAVLRPKWQSSDNALLGLALLNRYPTDAPLAAEKFRQEIGLEPADVRYVPDLVGPGGNKLHGEWLPEENRINIEGFLPPADKLGTLLHEYAHKADDYAAPNFSYQDPQAEMFPSGGVTSPTHHRDFSMFEPQMAQSMEAQRAIEEGLPVNPAVFDHYPWLKDVRASSSNVLANPWMRR